LTKNGGNVSLTTLIRTIAILMFVVVFSLPINASDKKTFDHSVFHNVLQKYVNENGYVDYTSLKNNRGDLDSYVEALGRTSPINSPSLFPDKNSKLAYWINAYNAFTLRGVIDNYPTKSVRDIHALYGFFWRIKFNAGGKKMSLRALENEIIRKFNEPRIHFAIVCASEGCPRLSREAYIGENLESQLEAQAKKFINEERNVKFDTKANSIQMSKIFDWFAEDFLVAFPGEKDKKKVTEYLKPYLNSSSRQNLQQLNVSKIEYIEYDWRINDQLRPDIKK
jgi:hypothetical protein